MKYYVDSNANLIIGFDKKIVSINYIDSKINNIYRGKIQKKIKGLGVFVNLGEFSGILQEQTNKNEGENILVKVIKEPYEMDKSVKISTELSITGKSMIAFDSNFIKVSSKIEKNRRKELLNFANENELKGVLFRTNAEKISNEKIFCEYKNLKEDINNLKYQENRLPSPKLIYTESLINRLNATDEDEILFNDEKLFEKYKNEVNTKLEKNFDIKYSYEILSDLKELISSEVSLKSGGNIVFEKTKAFTIIDINSKKVEGNDISELVKKINEEATIEIARQILLRNISGSIIIDYITTDEDERKKIIKLLKKEFLKDGKNTVIHGFTKLGLVEISRKNKGLELDKAWIR